MKLTIFKLNRLLVFRYVVDQCKYYSTKHNLHSLLTKMPKQVKHTAVLKQQRQKLKEKNQKYTPGIVTLQVLGSGAIGAPRSVYVFTDQSRYMFNCGEGTQRLAHEHKMKLAKLEHIFFTYGSWENIGGLPGISLTIQDVGVPEITLHGPQGIADIFSATRRFIVLKDLSVKTADYNENLYFEDNVMRVTYVPLNIEVEHVARTAVSLDQVDKRSDLPYSGEEGESSSSNCMTTDDETDYYAHERGGSKLPDLPKNKIKKKKKKNKRSISTDGSEENHPKKRCVELVGNVAMSYICKLHPRPGALNLEACVEKGVPPGPLLGRLKAGEDVTLPNGCIVKSSEVTSPDDPGPVFIVVECPNEMFLEPLEKEVAFTQHQSQATSPDNEAFLVVHFTPSYIVQNPRYKRWMNKFPSSTHHLMVNDENKCMGSTAVHRIQYKLNLLDPQVFPLLSDDGTPVFKSESSIKGSVTSESVSSNGSVKIYETNSVGSNCSSEGTDNVTHNGKTCCIVHLRPIKNYDSSNTLTLDIEEYKREVFLLPEMQETLDKLHESLMNYDQSVSKAKDSQEQEHPSVVFLGTGSCIPNKTRNTSGILINISDNLNMLLDCGEGTYGQLVRFHGKNNIKKLLSSMQAIFISHLHADHHIGLIGILKARRNCSSNSDAPLYLIAPKQIMTWLRYYNDHFEPILQQVELIPNSDLVYNNVTLPENVMKRVCSSLNMKSVSTAGVKHCPNSFGIAVEHKSGWKITYSGDTMPCYSLVELGKNSTLLIHEATMEDELKAEACVKMHSTTSEAIDMGKKMNAQFTMLTHFSQRYATLPRFNDNIKEGVGIAFDNMKVRFCDLPKLPLMYPALQLMFFDHQDELEQKAYRRQLKQLRMENSRSPSPAPKQ